MSRFAPRALRVAVVAGGATALVLWLVLLVYRPVVITTGSMAPSIPAGSLVVAHEQPADGVRVGDVIVMELERGVRVTHRVVDLSGPAGSRVAVTKGDANAAADPTPYPLTGTTLVVARVVPVLGTLVSTLGSPLIALAVVAAGLAGIAFSGRREPPDPAIDEQPRPRPRRSWRTIAGAVLLLLLGSAAATVTSLALFTDTEVLPDNSFTTGTLDISASPVSAAVTMAGMAPGDRVTAPLAVANDGSLELRYSIRSTTSEDTLASRLELTVKAGVTTCDDAGWSADGTVLYQGPLGSVAGTPVLGDPAPGADAGDRVLAPATGEELCLDVTLPLSVTNEAQGLSTSATFTLDAEQTVNNP